MRRIARRLASIPYHMRKVYQKVSTAKPSLFVLAAVAIALSVFLLGGGVYDILEREIYIAIPLRGRWVFYYPYTVHEQTILDSLLSMTLYAIGTVGFLLTYQSTRYAYKPRQAFILLLVGAVFIVVAYLYIEYIIWLKLTAPYQ
ncbi:MAG: OST3 / OST6 family protein [Candidatus Bathyarchaeota archaeon BA1]|nr:MAG: OST3 / OST6 family protein [Candidatus Bathyarchaeota archaeon BA1]